MSELLDKLAEEVLSHARWDDIAPHYARGVVIFVEGVSLVEAGAALARDRVAIVEQWLADGVLRNATDADAANWSASEARFQMLIVQPWILLRPQPD